MDISTVLNVNNIKLDMVATTKEAAIEELTDLLVKSGCVTDKATFLRDVWIREAQGPTGFENHIAIPHGESLAVSRIALAIGRTQELVQWQTTDDIKVHCIILYAIRINEENNHDIRLLTQFSSALADDTVIEKLLKDRDPNTIIDMVNVQIRSNDYY